MSCMDFSPETIELIISLFTVHTNVMISLLLGLPAINVFGSRGGFLFELGDRTFFY